MINYVKDTAVSFDNEKSRDEFQLLWSIAHLLNLEMFFFEHNEDLYRFIEHSFQLQQASKDPHERKGINAFFLNLQPTISKFKFSKSHDSYLIYQQPSFIPWLASIAPNLEKIKIQQEAKYDNIKLLSIHFPNIEKLIIFGSIKNKDIINIKHFHNLKKLHLTSNNLNDEILISIGKFPNLEQLNLRGCELITKIGISSLACHDLKKLDLSDCTKLTDEDLLSLGTLSKLEKLKLSDCYKITIKGITSLGYQNLKLLDLQFCEKIKADDLLLLRQFIQLEYLELDGCRQLTKHDIESLKSNFKNLKPKGYSIKNMRHKQAYLIK